METPKITLICNNCKHNRTKECFVRIQFFKATQKNECWESNNAQQTPLICEEKKVDFELLKATINNIEFLFDNIECISEKHQRILENERDNTILFFKMLSKSSSFAHKAHKELKRLS